MTTLREFFIWLSKNTSKRFPPRNCIKYHLLHKWSGRWGGIIITSLTSGSRGQDSTPSAFILLCSKVGYVPTIPLFTQEYKMGTTELSAKPDEIMWGGGVGKLWWASILWNTPCHFTPNQPLPKTPGKVRKLCDSFSYVNLQVLFFSNKQKLAIYLLAIFVIWSLLLTHNSLFFLLQFFKFFLKKYAKNLSFFLFCLNSLKSCERAVDKTPQ